MPVQPLHKAVAAVRLLTGNMSPAIEEMSGVTAPTAEGSGRGRVAGVETN